MVTAAGGNISARHKTMEHSHEGTTRAKTPPGGEGGSFPTGSQAFPRNLQAYQPSSLGFKWIGTTRAPGRPAFEL